MSETKGEYIVNRAPQLHLSGEERCQRCGAVLAKTTAEGSYIVSGKLPVVAIIGACPECKLPFILPRIDLLFDPVAFEELGKHLETVQRNRFGTITLEFIKGECARIGLHSERDVRGRSKPA